jgi:hypothetical protein
VFQQLPAGYNACRWCIRYSSTRYSMGERIDFLSLHRDRLFRRRHCDAAKIQLRLPLTLAATNQGACPGQLFAEIKWLGHVIVGTEIQKSNRTLHLRNCRQDQDGVTLSRARTVRSTSIPLILGIVFHNEDAQRFITSRPNDCGPEPV